MPVARERGIPVALMIGVRKAVNLALGDAGDSVGLADIATVEHLARDFWRCDFSGDPVGAREHAWPVCGRPQIQEYCAVRLLVVSQ